MKRGEEIKAKTEDRGKGKEEIDRGEREEGETDGHDLASLVGCRRKRGETEEGKKETDSEKNDRIIISVGTKTKRATGIIKGCDLRHHLEWLVHSPLFLLHFLVFLRLPI